VINEPLVPSAPSDESKSGSAELALAAAIAQGLRRHREAAALHETAEIKNVATLLVEPAPDTSFYLPEAPIDLPEPPTLGETSALRPHLPSAPTLVPIAAEKATPEPLTDGHVGEAAPAASKIGVLLVNLGAPDVANLASTWRFLKAAFNDPRVTDDVSSFWKRTFFWKMAISGFVLPVRSWRQARSCRKILNQDKRELPLRFITRSQAEKFISILEPLGKHVIVDWAMRYAEPSIAVRLQALVARGCDRILVMPLFPQYSSLTTASICDEVFRVLTGLRRQPALRIMPAYYDDPHYTTLLASALSAELEKLSFQPDVILASYQDVSREYLRNGDPYDSQCAKTTQLLREYLKVDEQKLMMTYQSRLGHTPWLQPSTIKTIKALAKKGVKSLVVVTPGFASDGLETLHDIAMEAERMFKRYGGENFAAVPCLNDSEAGMLLITRLAMRELEGWV
jgi:protoporphyrin/coproporphyrin ferrochelatase